MVVMPCVWCHGSRAYGNSTSSAVPQVCDNLMRGWPWKVTLFNGLSLSSGNYLLVPLLVYGLSRGGGGEKPFWFLVYTMPTFT